MQFIFDHVREYGSVRRLVGFIRASLQCMPLMDFVNGTLLA